jgi:hypothetical protein
VRNVLVHRPPLRDSLTAATILGPYFAELNELSRKAIAIRHAIEGLVREEKAAAEADRTAGALAIRRGEADPGDKASKAVAEKAAVLRRKAGNIAAAQQAVAGDVEQLLKANGVGWALEAQAQASTARRDAQAVLDTFQAGRELVADLEASARWLRSAGQAKAAARPTYVPGLVRANRSPYSLAEVLAALAAIDEPAPAADEEAEEAEPAEAVA